MTETFKTGPEMKEIAVVKTQTTKVLTAVQELEMIKSPEQMTLVTVLLSKIKTAAKMIKERKEAITLPLMEALNSSRYLFKPIEANLADAERVVKGKMLDYQQVIDAENEKKRLALAKKVETGYMKPETAVAKMEKIEDAPTTVQGSVGAITFRNVKKVRLAELGTLGGADLEYLAKTGLIEWSSSARMEALKGMKVPGAEVYEEKAVASRST